MELLDARGVLLLDRVSELLRQGSDPRLVLGAEVELAGAAAEIAILVVDEDTATNALANDGARHGGQAHAGARGEREFAELRVERPEREGERFAAHGSAALYAV
ncbi:MAG: hypothetical protein V2J24_03425 [Pseudomonadales bacterium]|jgi:hypothetical protein|nr:hypothetical protein [Pseudomonadales bacterium]